MGPSLCGSRAEFPFSRRIPRQEERRARRVQCRAWPAEGAACAGWRCRLARPGPALPHPQCPARPSPARRYHTRSVRPGPALPHSQCPARPGPARRYHTRSARPGPALPHPQCPARRYHTRSARPGPARRYHTRSARPGPAKPGPALPRSRCPARPGPARRYRAPLWAVSREQHRHRAKLPQCHQKMRFMAMPSAGKTIMDYTKLPT
ncbi:uncharacterized protein LOC135304069 [Passer domesticus]|uniref:uncharacterized protein LOC135304069 n=1 Tax=Passer domesticus TaxID=48849 RepID=UPI0030FF07D4